jgi:hypothetical protein
MLFHSRRSSTGIYPDIFTIIPAKARSVAATKVREMGSEAPPPHAPPTDKVLDPLLAIFSPVN